MLSQRQARCSFEAVYPDPLPHVGAASVGLEEERGSLSPEQKQQWFRHIQSGHLPYRKDCEVCVRGSATGPQHRRCVYKDTFVLLFDLAGPFSEVGRSYDSAGYKYLLVAGFRVPAELLSSAEPPKPEDLHPADDVQVPAPTEQEGDEGDPLLDLQDPDPSQVHAVDVIEEDCASVDFGDEGEPDDLEEVSSRPAIEESILAGEVPEKEVEEYFSLLSKPLLTEVLRFAVPLKNRNPEGVLEGLQQICGEIHRIGLPVYRLHSDREGTSENIRKWCYSNLIVPSYTQGQDP